MKEIILFLLLLFLLAAGVPVLQFNDATSSSHLKLITYSGGPEKNHILESTGNGVVAFDYDNDSDQDLFFINAYSFPNRGQIVKHPNVLFQNNGKGIFTDVTAKSGLSASSYGQGGCVGDINADGHLDLYVTNFGPNFLYRNNGKGTFTDITTAAGAGDPRWSIGCTFFDADKDGDHDLYVANYIDARWEDVHIAKRTRMWRGKVPVLDGPKGLPGSRDTFYLNNGNGTFTDATEKAGFLPGSDYYGMGVLSFDYDNDGDIDVYVANDSTPNCLYRNRGNGTFEEVGTISGVAYNADGKEQGSMGVDFGDYNNDGWFDLVVTNFANDYYTLYRNLDGQFFQDESFAAGIAVPTFVPLGWATFFFDADHDMDLDLFFSNGHIYPQVDAEKSLHETYRQKNQFFVNNGGRFREVTAGGGGLQINKSSRGAALADYDNDGDLDVAVSNADDAVDLLRNNSSNGNHWLTIHLIDTGQNPVPLGARVTLTAAGVTQHDQVSSGGGYASQNDLRLHFGLGKTVRADKITITWPDGKQENYTSLDADKHYTIRRGSKPVGR